MHLTQEDVREILRLLDESPYDELKIESEGFSLTLRRTADRSRPERPGRAPRDRGAAGARRG